VHSFPFQTRQLVGRAVFFQFFHKTEQQQLTALFKDNRTATKLNVCFYLVALGKETFGVA